MAVALLSCARNSAPPGGQPDNAPPRLIQVQPEAMSVVTGWDAPAVFRFDERISEQGIADVVLVSPATGEIKVDKGRSDLKVALEGGWRPGQIYRVVLKPGLRDLFGNVTGWPLELVFSTGPPIPETALAGEVMDRLTLEPVQDARVSAVRLADSVTHVAVSDSSGFYFMRHIPAGTYELRAYRDQNSDEEASVSEQQDSSAATLAGGDTVLVSFDLLVPDTTAAQLGRAETDDTAHVRLTFDDYMDPVARLDEVEVALWRLPDSARVEVAEVLHAHVWDRRVEVLAAVRQAAEADSLAIESLAVDSLAAALLAGDSLAADSLLAALPAAESLAVDSLAAELLAGEPGDTVAPPEAVPPEIAVAAGAAAGDSMNASPDSAKGPLPARELVILPAVPLAWGAQYSVSVSGVTNIAGLPGGSGTAQFETPAPPALPTADTTGGMPPDTSDLAAPDTTGSAADTTPILRRHRLWQRGSRGQGDPRDGRRRGDRDG